MHAKRSADASILSQLAATGGRPVTAVFAHGNPAWLPVRTLASGNARKFKGFAEECMAEYNLYG